MHWRNLSTLKDTCKIDTSDQWCKIMCDGVASAISGQGGCILEEPFHLKDTCKIDTCDQWCKIMCGGVASAISGDKADAFGEPFHPKGHMQD